MKESYPLTYRRATHFSDEEQASSQEKAANFSPDLMNCSFDYICAAISEKILGIIKLRENRKVSGLDRIRSLTKIGHKKNTWGCPKHV